MNVEEIKKEKNRLISLKKRVDLIIKYQEQKFKEDQLKDIELNDYMKHEEFYTQEELNTMYGKNDPYLVNEETRINNIDNGDGYPRLK